MSDIDPPIKVKNKNLVWYNFFKVLRIFRNMRISFVGFLNGLVQ